MLVLSRKASQQVLIGGDIRITVVRIDRNRVRLGIQAPAGLAILRTELADAPIARPRRPGDQNTPAGGGAASSPESSSPRPA
jgi:carbon storage regulator